MKGGLKKLLGVALLFTLYPLSFLVRRNDSIWVFGSHRNSFSDNSKYQFLWTSKNARNIKPVWISGSKKLINELRSKGYTAHSRWSPAGLITTLRAGVYVYSSYLSDINFLTSGRAKRVNLWHGVGLKKIEFKIDSGPLRAIYRNSPANWSRLLVPHAFARPDIMLSTSPMMTDHFSACFRITQKKCFEAMYPRLALHTNTELEMQALQFGQYDEIKEKMGRFGNRWIYMPTWRDDQSKNISTALPDLKALNESLKHSNSLLFIKAHPNEKLCEHPGESNIVFWDVENDIYPLLHEFDGLITDYSSILYDFLAIDKKKIILYNYDYEDYINNSRDFSYPYSDNTTGSWVRSFQELCEHLKRPSLLTEFNPSIREKFWAHQERGPEQIHANILSHL